MRDINFKTNSKSKEDTGYNYLEKKEIKRVVSKEKKPKTIKEKSRLVKEK
jgi:hypothetical protein